MSRLKSLVLRTLPDPLLFHAKRLRYPGVIRAFRPSHAAVLHALVHPGDRVLDAGANIGWYTRVFSELVGPAGRVLSVEPVPPTFALLSHCVRRLGLTNVELFNSALSDHAGSVIMEVPRYEEGGDNFYGARVVARTEADARLRSFVVPVSSVDLLLGSRLGRLAFVKCDVEGHELAVVRGARASLVQWRPAMLIEVTTDPDDPSASARALLTELAEIGYGAYRFDGHGLARRREGQQSVDYFFLTEEQIISLRRAHVRVA